MLTRTHRALAAVTVLWSSLLFGADIRIQGPVVIAGEDDWAPYSYAHKQQPGTEQEPQGFSAQLIRAAFATQQIEVQFLTLPFARCMRLAQTDKVAGCFNATITDENRNAYIWHKPPLFREELSIFGRPDSATRALTKEDLRGKSVAITNGYTYPSTFMQDPRIKKFPAASDDNLIQMLLSKRVDFILMNRTPGTMRIQATANARGQVVWRGTLSADDFWIAFSRQHPQGQQLANAFSKGLAQLHETGNYQRMLDSFHKQIGIH